MVHASQEGDASLHDSISAADLDFAAAMTRVRLGTKIVVDEEASAPPTAHGERNDMEGGREPGREAFTFTFHRPA